MQDRRQSQYCRLERVAGCGIIAPRRTHSAHLHRPWRANLRQSTREHPIGADLTAILRRSALKRDTHRFSSHPELHAFAPLGGSAPTAQAQPPITWAISIGRDSFTDVREASISCDHFPGWRLCCPSRSRRAYELRPPRRLTIQSEKLTDFPIAHQPTRALDGAPSIPCLP